VLLVEPPDGAQEIVDPRDAAESAGLRYVSDERPGIRRKKAGTGFSYTRPDGSRLITSGLPQQADLLRVRRHVSNVPRTDIRHRPNLVFPGVVGRRAGWCS
jgi:hypothetical protein